LHPLESAALSRRTPIPAVRGTAIEPPESTHNGRSLRLTLSICLPLLFEIQ
jgi:hypothetical protein